MAASSPSFSLPTQDPDAGVNPNPDSANPGSGSTAASDIAGASGTSPSGYGGISQKAMIVIIVVVVIVCMCGIASAVLFYLAKKREWKVREGIRRSAKKVATALTPRRSEFPRSLKDDDSGTRPKGRRIKHEDVPPTPRIQIDQRDPEKGSGRVDKKRIKSIRE